MRKKTSSFVAEDASGRLEKLVEFTDFIEAGTLDGGPDLIPGMKSLMTTSGLNVNRLDKGKYQVVQTGVMLTSSDPEAL